MKTYVYIGRSFLGIISNTKNGEIINYDISIRQSITAITLETAHAASQMNIRCAMISGKSQSQRLLVG